MVHLPTDRRLSRLRMMAGAGCAALVIAASPMAALAQSAVASFDIRPAPLSQSMLEFGRQAGISISADRALTSGVQSRPVSGNMSVEQALEQLLEGTGLSAQFYGPNTVRLIRTGQGDNLGNDLQTHDSQEATAVADIIVTAQKREESIQDVPIAVSAFSAGTLDAMKIEGGSELLRAIPNVTFSKSNFSMYNFAIRGIGTKAISSSSDPAVAVSFNNSPMIRNRLFEAEYLDVNRVEVLRGPQGTLYGRNATAGVVNMIPNLPRPDFDAMMKAEVGNFGSVRGQMMLNIPVSDTFWLRGAASLTKRDGYDFNTHTGEHINGRDLHTVRVSAAWEPSDSFKSSLTWERFGENDDRLRTGKQLCTRDPGITQVGSFTVTNLGVLGKLNQGCIPGSLYDDAAYGAPNASGFGPVQVIGNLITIGGDRPTTAGRNLIYAIDFGADPYKGVSQSKNLREISTTYEPKFNASNDVFQINLEYKPTDNLSIFSQTMYTKDSYFSTQDYSRYMSNPIFNDSDNVFAVSGGPPPFPKQSGTEITPGGYFTDPQLGPSRGMMSADLSLSESDQFYQEFRLQSNFDGAFDFSIGLNYLDFKVEDNYYVFNNTFTMMAQYLYAGYTDGRILRTRNCQDSSTFTECVYVDRSPISNLVGDGHNYFRSKNEVSTKSSAIFGELYWNINDDLKLTAGGRYTKDKKTSTPYPSQLLLGFSDIIGGPVTGGSYAKGYRADPDVKQEWGAFTGRLVLDWKINQDAMAYASLARGYKGGGTNPPRPGINPAVVQYRPLAAEFDPEYVTSLEFGLKSNLFDNSLRFNATAFYYDYSDYQVSQIVDRISLNENFDAISTGAELEVTWHVTPKFQLNGNFGYLKTRIGDGEKSIDVMNRTQGNDDWVVLRPYPQVPSNCIAPKDVVEKVVSSSYANFNWIGAMSVLCGGIGRLGSYDPSFPTSIPLYNILNIVYRPLIDAPNGGRGFDADLSGNSLPNSPSFTLSVGAQYTMMINNWNMIFKSDYYYQDESFFRVYNTEYDRIRGWGNLNAAIELENIDTSTSIQFYVKNILDDAPIVDAFTNSDDTMLTTNVFTLDPRIWGFSLTKRF